MTQAILLIDAVTQDLTPLHAALRAQGYAPTTVVDTSEPLAEFSTTAYELVFINMSCRDAHGLCDGIRNKPEGTITPIIFIGDGKHGISSPADALAAGGDYYFSMPLDLPRITAKVQTYVGAPIGDADTAARASKSTSSSRAKTLPADDEALDDDLMALTKPTPKSVAQDIAPKANMGAAKAKTVSLDDEDLLDEIASPSAQPVAAPKTPPRSTPEKTAPSPVVEDDFGDLDSLRSKAPVAAKVHANKAHATSRKNDIDPLRDADTLTSEPAWAAEDKTTIIAHPPPEALSDHPDEAIAQATLEGATMSAPVQHMPPPPAPHVGDEGDLDALAKPAAQVDADEGDDEEIDAIAKPASQAQVARDDDRDPLSTSSPKASSSAAEHDELDDLVAPKAATQGARGSTAAHTRNADLAATAARARDTANAAMPTSADPYQAAHDEPLDELEELAILPVPRAAVERRGDRSAQAGRGEAQHTPPADDVESRVESRSTHDTSAHSNVAAADSDDADNGIDELRLRSEWSTTADDTGNNDDDYGHSSDRDLGVGQPVRSENPEVIASDPLPSPKPPPPAPPEARATQDLAEASNAVLAEISRREAELAREAEALRREAERLKQEEARLAAAEAARLAAVAEAARQRELERQAAEEAAARAAAEKLAREKAEAEEKVRQAVLEAEARARAEAEAQREREVQRKREEDEARARAAAEQAARKKAANEVRRAEEDARRRAEEEALAAAAATHGSRSSSTRNRATAQQDSAHNAGHAQAAAHGTPAHAAHGQTDADNNASAQPHTTAQLSDPADRQQPTIKSPGNNSAGAPFAAAQEQSGGAGDNGYNGSAQGADAHGRPPDGNEPRSAAASDGLGVQGTAEFGSNATQRTDAADGGHHSQTNLQGASADNAGGPSDSVRRASTNNAGDASANGHGASANNTGDVSVTGRDASANNAGDVSVNGRSAPANNVGHASASHASGAQGAVAAHGNANSGGSSQPASSYPVTQGATIAAALPNAEIIHGKGATAPLSQTTDSGVPTLGQKTLEPPTGALSGNRDLPSLFIDCHAQNITGRLDITADQRQKTVFFENGAPVDAYSSQLYDRMEEYLLRHGKITRSQYQEVRAKRFRTAREVGAYLVNEGFLKTEELFTSVRGQLEEIVYGLFEWEEATYSYRNEITGLTDRVFLDWDPRALVLEGVRRKFSMERLVKAVGSPASLVGLHEEAAQVVKVLRLTPDEIVALRLLDGQRTVEDLVFSSGLEAQRIYQLVYGLVLCGAAVVVARGLDPLTDDNKRSDSIDKARILEKTEQVRFLDYFAMLGITREATPYEIERACQEASEAFEPAKFSNDVQHELRTQLAEIVEVLGDAKHVLGDPDRRDAYARHLP